MDIEFANPGGAIADGIAAEVALSLAPIPAARVPRSALTFSGNGQLGLRVVEGDQRVGFRPINIVDDEADALWVSGVEDGILIITRGQDFIREGETVEPVASDP